MTEGGCGVDAFLGIVDMSKPVHRHLVEQKWKSEGDLDLLVSFVSSLLRWWWLMVL